MIYGNAINFGKFVSSDSKEKFYDKNIIKSIIFRKFSISFIKNNDFCLISTKKRLSAPKYL